MITRTIRDIFTNDIDTIWVDEPNAFAHASEFLQIVMPRFADRIRFHADTEPLFNRYRVEDEIAKINHKRIDLPQGGSIIIEQTEALVANDVIDMRDPEHRRRVEDSLRDALVRDRARTKILSISQFGIIEMTRQRIQ